MRRRVGALALQGGFAMHVELLRAIGHEVIEVRTARELEGCDGLVLPGGESGVMLRMLERDPELERALFALVERGAPVLATCAGLVLAAREVRSPEQRSFGWIDVAVRRNAWGRQLHSAEALADDGATKLVLIRAPRIEDAGDGVEIELALDGEPVLVRQGAVFGATFHPEVQGDGWLHRRVFGDPQ